MFGRSHLTSGPWWHSKLPIDKKLPTAKMNTPHVLPIHLNKFGYVKCTGMYCRISQKN